MIAHASLCATAVIIEVPVEPTPPEPQPMAVMVEFVTDPTVKQEERQEVRKGDPNSDATEDAAPEENDVEETEKADAAPALPLETLPQSVPVPAKRPKPERRKTERKFPDKTRLALARGLEEDPRPDVVLADTLKAPGNMDASFADQTTRGVIRDVAAQERWQMRLLAHLERRKRYPRSALSQRKEGVVHVRFLVDADGSVLLPDLALSSGVPELDNEVLDLVRRASPVPKPPEGVNTFVTVPVSFNVKQ